MHLQTLCCLSVVHNLTTTGSCQHVICKDHWERPSIYANHVASSVHDLQNCERMPTLEAWLLHAMCEALQCVAPSCPGHLVLAVVLQMIAPNGHPLVDAQCSSELSHGCCSADQCIQVGFSVAGSLFAFLHTDM